MKPTVPKRQFPYRAEFVAAVWCFLLAALAGLAMRLVGTGMALPEHVDFTNVRRAHSHLMLFGWVTPALFALIAAPAGFSRGVRRVLHAALLLAVLCFPSFLIWGYGSASIGEARIPISVIVSTLSMFAWYAFVAIYVRLRAQLKAACGELSVALWDGALALLVIGSAGAWARGAFIGMKIEDPLLTAGSIEFFLSSFADGFLLLGVMGLLFSGFEAKPRDVSLARLLALVIPFEFLALLPIGIVPSDMRLIGAVGVVAAGGLTALLGARLVARGRGVSRGAGVLLVVLGGSKLLLADAAMADAIFALGLRVPYLHVLLLGLVSWTLFEEAVKRWPGAIGPGPIGVAIGLMLVGLLPTTGLWPSALPRDAGLFFTALSSLGPIVVAAAMLRGSRRAKHPHHPVGAAASFEPVRPSISVHHADERRGLEWKEEAQGASLG